jgi:hypothetical protein
MMKRFSLLIVTLIFCFDESVCQTSIQAGRIPENADVLKASGLADNQGYHLVVFFLSGNTR